MTIGIYIPTYLTQSSASPLWLGTQTNYSTVIIGTDQSVTMAGAVTIAGTTKLDGGNGYFRDGVGNSFSSGWDVDSDSHATWINFEGYQGGTTKFRDLRIGNGKQSAMAIFDGSSGHVAIGAASAGTRLDILTIANVAGILNIL